MLIERLIGVLPGGRRARALVWVAAIAACGCDNEVTPSTGGAGGSGSSSSDASTGASTSVGMPGAGAVLAVTQLHLGAESVTAWQQYGVNLDGVATTTDFSAHCTPNQNASPKNIFPDGPGGVDNSWGRSILPIFKSLFGATDIEVTANLPIVMGRSTLLLDLADLGMGPTQAPVTLFGLLGTNLSAGSWEIAPESLTGATPDTSKMTFPTAALNGNTLLASGGTLLVNVGLGVPGPDVPVMRLTLHAATVRAALSADHGSISSGILGGVLDTEEFVTELERALPFVSADVCQGQVLDSIVNQVRQASDILKDGTQSPGTTCNGISIGLGFDGALTTLGPVAMPAPPDPDPCVK